MDKVGNVRRRSSYQGQGQVAPNLVLEVPPYCSEGFRLSEDDEVDGGACRVEEDGSDQSLEVNGQLGLISHLQELSSKLKIKLL